MYAYKHDPETGGLLLTDVLSGNSKEPRPVYSRELDILGFAEIWDYERQDDAPYLWAEANFYWYRGVRVAHTTGGSLYEKPTIVLEKDEHGNDFLPLGTTLEKVNLPRMAEKNSDMLAIIEKTTIKKIYDVYQRYKNKLDCFHVAFSGGKDSIVLLELVKRALPKTAFLVIFGDTGMEFPDTYDAVDKVEEQCRKEGIAFYRAASHLKPEESWKLFGPPSRVLRWCCSVHKSAPQALTLRKITGKPNYTGLAFVGVRSQESLARDEQLTKKPLKQQSKDELDFVDSFEKVKGQKTAKSIYDWTSAEIWLYIICNQLTINQAYKKGSARVGCIFCPLEGARADYIQNINYPQIVSLFANIIIQSNARKEISAHDYLLNSGWIARKNGRFLTGNIEKYKEESSKNTLQISFENSKTDWKQWIRTIGDLNQISVNKYVLVIDNNTIEIYVEDIGTKTIIKIDTSLFRIKPVLGKLFRNVFRKAVFCQKCGVCSSNCLNGCINFDLDVSIEGCKHCHRCHEVNNGCLAYDSLKIPTEEKTAMISGINCYSNHAPKLEWLTKFFKGENYLGNLGGPQKTKFKRFLKDAKLLEANSETTFCQKIRQLNWSSQTSLALMLINLTYTPQFNWYIRNIPINKEISREEIEQLLEEAGQSKDNISSITSAYKRICDLPFGSKLNFKYSSTIHKHEIFSRTKTTLSDARVILYSLYKFAEACEGYYEFSLSRLMDFTVESAGVSPAEIFGLDRGEMEAFLHGLARSYPDYISFTTTHDLENIRLSDDKTSEDVLTLFD